MQLMFRRPMSLFLLVLISGLSSFNLIAQESMRFGLHVSPNVNWFEAGTDDFSTSPKWRVSYGLMGDFFLTERYAISSGITIASRGASLDLQDTVGEYHMNLLQFPLALKMRTQQFNRMTYFAQFGGTIGFKTGEEVNLQPDRTEAQHLDAYFTNVHTQFIIGLGAEYELDGSSSVVFGLDYTRALNDTLRDEDLRIGKRENYRLWGLRFTLGFFF